MTMPPGFRLAAERPDDAAAIDALLDLAFGAARHAKRSYAYRRDVDSVAALRVVARDPAGRLVGTLRFWPIAIEGGDGAVRRSALLLGPLAVEPHLKGQGVGRALMAEGLGRAASLGHDLVLLVGDLAYYGQFGFVPAAPLGFVMPGEQPHRLLCRVDGAEGGGGPIPGVLVPVATMR
jgi:predicted N-acetyltransferase YhbS